MKFYFKALSLNICIFLFYFSEINGQNECVYGKIVDNTGECLSNVSVALMLNGSIVAGPMTTKLNGEYAFNITQGGPYQLNFEKAEYDKFSYDSFYVNTGDSLRKDVPLQKPPRFISITEVNDHTKEIEIIDIGTLASRNSYYVDFFNSGGVDINYVTGQMSEWITAVTPSSGILKPNESNRIVIKIDPDKFEAGKITGKLLILTDNGSKILSIKATGGFPKIKTFAVTTAYNDSQNLFPDTFKVEVEFNGRHTFKKMGYCFSDANSTPTINDNVVIINDLGRFEYKDYWTDTGKHLFPWLGGSELCDPKFACRTYYVRAFCQYENENNIVNYSSNVAQFTLWKILCK